MQGKRGGLLGGVLPNGGAGSRADLLPTSFTVGVGATTARGVGGADLENHRQGLRAVEAECDTLRSQVARLQHQLADAERNLQHVTAERDGALGRVQELEEFLRPFLDRRERWQQLVQRSVAQVRLHTRLAANAARELHAAREGRKLEKINERHGKLEARQVAVCCEEMQLRWWHSEKGGLGGLISGGTSAKSLDLQTVTRLQYGHETALQSRFPEVSPWLCFTLITAERPYEFVCPDEHAVKCFVLALSRACPNIPGTIPSRRDFILRKAWCKINEACNRKGKTFAAIVAEAGRLSESLRPVSVKVPTLSAKASASSRSTASKVVDRSSLAPPRPPSNSTTSSGLLCIESFLASATSVSPPQRRGAWPKAGETWAFTGVAAEVDVYRDSMGLEWSNQIKCVDKATGRRAVTIVSVPESGSLVEIRGTDKLKFVKGWMRPVDANETWLMEKVCGP